MQTLDLLKKLIACPSVTPNDAGCQKILADCLQKMNFTVEHLRFGDVDNLWARRGTEAPLFVFAGHTDVVPTGPVEQWTSPPFTPTERDGFLYGRGTADMKSGLAAMIVACEEFLKQHPNPRGSIAFLITSDEEGTNVNGTVKVVEHLKKRCEKISWCLVGEPTSVDRLGDTVKNGRRGSLSAKLIIKGIQGHIAYPHIAENPIHKSLAALSELTQTIWDHGNDFFQPTSFQISNVHAGTGAGNVIPGEIEIDFNFRYSPEVTAEQLKEKVEKILATHQLNYSVQWDNSAKPFLTPPGELVQGCCEIIKEITGIQPAVTTTGGTSDARFIAPMGCQILELGPTGQSSHSIDERVSLLELDQLTQIYRKVLDRLL